MRDVYNHFSRIAHRYRDLRRTDVEPILYIREKLRKFRRIVAADVGCGCGRYDLKLFQYLCGGLFLYCIDCNQKMLEQLGRHLSRYKITAFQVRRALASDLPLQDGSLDCIFTFNAIHHFPLSEFLSEALRVLKEKGQLFIYTRLRSQNSKNIWGRYFPFFEEKEPRLYELEELEHAVGSISGLSLQSVRIFRYYRISDLDTLVGRVQNNHYSTFYLYANGEFERSLERFKQNLKRRFRDLNTISWYDENVLLHIKKQTLRLA